MGELRTALREEDVLRHVVLGALLLAGIAVLSGDPVVSVVPLLVVAVVWELFDVAADVYGLPDGTKPVVIGAALAGLSVYWLAGRPETPWLPVAALAFGGWLIADGYKTYRDGPVTRPRGTYFEGVDGRPGEAMYRMQEAGRVVRALEDRPRPADELAADLGLTDSHAEEILETLAERGMVERSGGVYYPNESRLSKTAPVVRFLEWLPRRLLRPFR